MKLDTHTMGASLRDVRALTMAAEEIGFDGLWTAETSHDPFLPLAVAAEHTERAVLGTAIAVAFPRTPLVLAQVSWDLQAMSNGRFVLGLGTQVKGHNERRLGVRWERPGPKLREMVLAIRAIWDCWQKGTRPSFNGQFYNFTLMTPFFNPGPIEHPEIPIYIAGVNEYMCQLAGELCDGFHIHPFHSIKHLKEVVFPNVATGAKKAGRRPEDVTMSTSVFVIAGANQEEIEAARAMVRQQISFYASTRTYKGVLDVHGWGDTCVRLNEKVAKGDWASMAAEITDEMLDVYSVIGTHDEIVDKLKRKYDGVLDRLAFYQPFVPGQQDDRWRELARAFNG